jgi:hypothetical protein
MLILGEVRTSLLPTSAALPATDRVRVLALTAGAEVLRSDRPISIVVSPERLTGVDCQIPVDLDAKGRTVRAVGTVASRAVLTGGHILQGSARTVVERADHERRRPWSHYLARRGTIEALADFRADRTAAAFAATTPAGAQLNLHAIGGRTADRVSGNPVLDADPPLRTSPTGLRWSALLPPGEPPPGERNRISFVVGHDGRRTVQLVAHGAAPAEVTALCEDLALHDWLLTTLTGILDRAGPDLTGTTAGAARIRSVVEHLLHMWMPGARLPVAMRRFWPPVEESAGFGLQWTTSVQRIRDHLAVATLRRLGTIAPGVAS